MTKKVKFYWWKSYKVWEVSGANIEEISKKAAAISDRYNAIHFEII